MYSYFRIVRSGIEEITNWPNNFISKLLNPVLYLLFLGIAMNSMINKTSNNISYIVFLFPGLLCIEASNSFSRTIFMSSNHLKWGVISLFVLTGSSIIDYIAAMITTALVLFLTQATILGLIMLAFGFAPITSILRAVFTSALGLLFWVPAGLIIGITIKGYMKRDLITTIVVLPLMLSSTAFYDLHNAPVVLRFISYLNPITCHVDLVRSSFSSNQALNRNALIIFIILIIFTFISALLLLKRTDLVSGER